MSSKGIWLTVLMRSAHFNSLTRFDVAQQPLLLHIPCYKSSGRYPVSTGRLEISGNGSSFIA
jgi:hypothetical protein